MSPPLLEVQGLTIAYPAGGGLRRVVEGLDLRLAAGEALGLVGESGSGKSQTLLSLLGLLPATSRISGQRRFEGQDLARLDERGWNRLRGGAIGLVFQDAMTALNPYLRIGDQLTEVLALHRGLGGAAAEAEAARWLSLVKIPGAALRLRQYPHELSGGQRQRVMLAMALCGGPRLLLADEPTTALDVTVQAEVLNLLRELRQALGLALILVTHDLAVVAQTCDRTLVLYGGQAMEEGPTRPLLTDPQHPYTQALLAARPDRQRPGSRLLALPPAEAAAAGAGCAFRPRCGHAQAPCGEASGPWRALEPGRWTSCQLRPSPVQRLPSDANRA
ncbi:MAG TPA: ABC transporter ATP-binding protein [Nevskiaceae bacterium]|nr:ABC transporter ATP-binding protein [Nevskiaceae bacterium]